MLLRRVELDVGKWLLFLIWVDEPRDSVVVATSTLGTDARPWLVSGDGGEDRRRPAIADDQDRVALVFYFVEQIRRVPIQVTRRDRSNRLLRGQIFHVFHRSSCNVVGKVADTADLSA